jgi:hypothetical protein
MTVPLPYLLQSIKNDHLLQFFFYLGKKKVGRGGGDLSQWGTLNARYVQIVHGS